MTEKEKMINGLLYLASDKMLTDDRASAKALTFAFNQLHPSQVEQREEMIRKLFGKTGENVWIEPSFQCDYGYNIAVGENFYANHNCVILDVARVTIGDNVLLAPCVGIYTAAHPLDAASRNAGLEYGKPVTIGNNVWIGGGASVLPGVHIGENTVIGAGSVVTRDIEANAVAVGNPCRVIRTITQEDRR